MRTVWAVGGAIATAVLALAVAGAVVVLVAVDAGAAAWIVGVAGAAVVVATAFLLVWLVPALDHRHFRYEVTDLGLYVARGWLWRRWQGAPHPRVGTGHIKKGPPLPALGLL